MVGIKRPWSFFNDNSSNSFPEQQNKRDNGKPSFRDACLLSSSHQINWKPHPEFDFRAKDNGGLDGAFLTLGPSSSSSSSNSRSKQSPLVSTECHDVHEYQTQPSQDALRGSAYGDLMSSLRFSTDERWTGLVAHQFHHQHHLHHSYPYGLPHQYQYQAGAQFYSFLCPQQNVRASEPEDGRDADGTNEKADVDLRLKL